jgi:hypothetical protein
MAAGEFYHPLMNGHVLADPFAMKQHVLLLPRDVKIEAWPGAQSREPILITR